MQRNEADFRPVAEQQENECDIQERRIEFCNAPDQYRPGHGRKTATDYRARRHIDENGAEESERYSDASQYEILPGSFERFRRPVDADHENGRQRRQLNRHPHQANVVGNESQVHAEHHELEHRVVESQVNRREPSRFEFVLDVACAEYAGGERHEGVQDHEHDVQFIDLRELAWCRPMHEQKKRGKEGDEARDNVQPRRPTIVRDQRQHACRDERNEQHKPDRIEGHRAHRRSRRTRSSARISTLSNRSRIRKRKIPITMKAISTEKATLISTTSGMPFAPVAARTSPFSSDMKPITWLTALRRDTIIRRPSSTMESAKARSSRARGSAAAVTRSMTTIERATSAMPASMF